MATDSMQGASSAMRDVAYAGFWARFAALLVDSAILVIIMVGVAIAIAAVLPGEAAVLIGQVVIFMVYLLYWPVMESSSRQATFGKSIVGIKVTDLNGARLSFVRAFLRNLAKIVSAIPADIGFLLAAFTRRKQALHDILTNCLVVRAGPSHFIKALAAAVGGLVIAAGGAGAYVYYVVIPQFKNEVTGGMQEARKGAPAVKSASAKPPAEKGPPAGAQPPAPTPGAPTTAAAAAAQPASTPKPVAAAAPPEPAKPAPVAQTSAPAKSVAATPAPAQSTKAGKPAASTRAPVQAAKPAAAPPPPAEVAKVDSEPRTPARRRRAAPPATLPAPAPAVASAPAAAPSVITPKYNDVMTAAMYGDEDAVNQLIDLGWWVDKPSSTGFTPLMAAAMNRNARMVHVLLTRGANPNAQGPGGVTALKLARDRNDTVTATVLELRGAR